MRETIIQKEQNILSVCYECNKQLQNLIESDNSIKVKMNLDRFHWGFRSLMESCQVEFEDNIPNIKPKIENLSGNYYAYLKKVLKFLDGYEPSLQHNLFESETEYDLIAFKQTVKEVLNHLEHQNQLDSNINEQVIKLKSSFRKPLFVHGMNVAYNQQFIGYVYKKFNIPSNINILSVVYNRYTKSIFYVFQDLNVIEYKVVEDSFEQHSIPNLTKENYLQQIKDYQGINDLIELYTNIALFDVVYSDNLYADNRTRESVESYLNKLNQTRISR